MGYPRGIDEYDEQELKDELRRRERARLDGLCDYCGRSSTDPACRMTERHKRTGDVYILSKEQEEDWRKGHIISIIKDIREETGLSLKDAKALFDKSRHLYPVQDLRR